MNHAVPAIPGKGQGILNYSSMISDSHLLLHDTHCQRPRELGVTKVSSQSSPDTLFIKIFGDYLFFLFPETFLTSSKHYWEVEF